MKTRSATRVSKGLPRKRPSYDLEDLRPCGPSRPKKRIRQSQKKKFPLMKLPAEIRLKILRDLLWQPEPLKIKREMKRLYPRPISAPFLNLSATDPSHGDFVDATNWTFHPAILAACRKLNEEGSPVLYEENALDVTFSCNPLHLDEYSCDWMGHRLPKWLSERAEKLRITLKVKRPNYEPAKTIRTYVREMVEVLRKNEQWCRLDIRLEYDAPDQFRAESLLDEEDEVHPDEEILRPFNLLRQLRHVEITGVSPQFATRLSNMMKSDSPIIDLPRMYERLCEYAYDFLPDRLIPHEDMCLVEAAMDADNVADFYKHRDKIMREHRGVFSCDPDPISMRLPNNVFVGNQQRLENLQRENGPPRGPPKDNSGITR